MKKLLLFIMILLGVLSTQSLADSFGCGVTIPIEVCKNPGGTQNSGQSNNTYSNKYYGAIAINEDTGAWASAYNYTSKKEAQKSVLERCEGNCKIIQMSPSECGALAYSDSEGTFSYEAAGFWWTGEATQQEILKKAEERALKKCKSKDGKACEIKESFCSYMK